MVASDTQTGEGAMAEESHEDFTGSRANGGEPGHTGDRSEIEELRRRIEALQVDADKRLRAIVSERPLLVLGAAVAAGFVLGRTMRRL
jgi:hypothetical protein